MTEPYLLIYDGECTFCRRARDWIMERAPAGALRPLACQDEERPVLAPQVSSAACMEAMQLVTPEGTVYAGADAFPLLFRLLPGYRWLARVMTLPGLRQLAPPVYRWIARHRGMLSSWLPPEQGGTHCSLDGKCR